MNYLIINGHEQAAANFSKEANIKPEVDLESIRERIRVRTSILEGEIQSAIEGVNEIGPEVCRLHHKSFNIRILLSHIKKRKRKGYD